MISTLKIENFKSIRSMKELNLAPLTILCGTNSSGKSSLLQPILLLAQTLRGDRNKDNHLITRKSSLLGLGSFADVKNAESDSDIIAIDFKLTSIIDNNVGSFHFEFTETSNCSIGFEMPQLSKMIMKCRKSQEPKNHIYLRASLPLSTNNDKDTKTIISDENTPSDNCIKCCVFENLLPHNIEVFADRFWAEIIIERIIAILKDQDYINYENCFSKKYSMLEKYSFNQDEAKYLEREFDIHFPVEEYIEDNNFDYSIENNLDADFDKFKKLIRKAGYTSKEYTMPLGKITSDTQQWLTTFEEYQRKARIDYNNLIKNKARYPDSEPKEDILTLPLPKNIGSFTATLQDVFQSDIHYLKPMRVEPADIYISEFGSTKIGSKGELTAQRYFEHKDDYVEYIPLCEFENKTEFLKEDMKRQSAKLRNIVSSWLQYLEIADELIVNEFGDTGHFELKVKNGNRPNDLTNVGTGVSQVLPILVMCLLAKKDDIIIIEEPEAHLHPKMQSRLADFFISIALLGKQCILETHSDHIINKVRLRIAQAPCQKKVWNEMFKQQTPEMSSDFQAKYLKNRAKDYILSEPLNDKVKIIFSQKYEGATGFNPIGISVFSAMSDWPEGFMDEEEEIVSMIVSANKNKDL
jgi:predicted ATPase